MQNLMAQAQKMQRDLTKKKEEIENSEFTGSSEWVNVTLNGKKEVKEIKFTYTGTLEEDDKEALEDMLKIALNEAVAKIDKEYETKMGSLGSLGGMF